jgi:hypothetical protein
MDDKSHPNHPDHNQTTGEIHDAPALDGEIIEPVGTGVLATIHRVEIDQQVTTAKAYPRNLPMIQQELTALCTLNEETAEECVYALPRGGKTIRGPSARFADALISFWGNSRTDAYVVQVDREDKFIEAVGIFQDVERNVIRRRRVRRPISDRQGRLYNADMINMTGNAACVIAERNAILNGIPKPLWTVAYDRAFALIAGTIQTLDAKRDRAMKQFANNGIQPAQVLEILGRVDISKIVPDDIVTMRGMLTALKTGEETVESIFGRGAAGPTHDVVKDPLKDPGQKIPVRGAAQATAEVDTVIDASGTVKKWRSGKIGPPLRDERFAAGKQLFLTLEAWVAATVNMPLPVLASGNPVDGGDPISSGRQAPEKPAGEAAPAGGGNSPAKPEVRQPAQPSGQRPYDGPESYIEFMRDEFDKARSEAAVNELWGATRNDRRELLGADELVELEKDKKAKLAALKLKKSA